MMSVIFMIEKSVSLVTHQILGSLIIICKMITSRDGGPATQKFLFIRMC